MTLKGKGDKSGVGNLPALRPWNWRKEQPWMLSMVVGGKSHPGDSQSAIGFAALGLGNRKLSEGEHVFGESDSDEQKIAQAVMMFKLQLAAQMQEAARKGEGLAGPAKVQLYRYHKKSFPKSRAAQEGMSHEHHNRQVDRLAEALTGAGADVKVKVV